MATNNAVNNASDTFKSTAITVDPGASGDSYIQFNINATPGFRVGVDDSDSDNFKISSGSALGTSDTFIADVTNGWITRPLTPSFLASINAEANVTGNTTLAVIGAVTATTEIFDIGSNFTPGNGAGTGATFTAPVTGRYLLFHALAMALNVTGGEEIATRFSTSNRIYWLIELPGKKRLTTFTGPSGLIQSSAMVVTDMDISDTVTFAWISSAGAKVDDANSGYIGGALLL